jgi:hypothetical protein
MLLVMQPQYHTGTGMHLVLMMICDYVFCHHPNLCRLCSTTQPGEGRVLACLQQKRAEITGGTDGMTNHLL